MGFHFAPKLSKCNAVSYAKEMEAHLTFFNMLQSLDSFKNNNKILSQGNFVEQNLL